MARSVYDALAKAAVAPGPEVGIELEDPNPMHLVGGHRDESPLPACFWRVSIPSAKRALGACADGASLLLVRVRVPQPGRVSLTLQSDGEPGGLMPLGKAAAPLEGPVVASVEGKRSSSRSRVDTPRWRSTGRRPAPVRRRCRPHDHQAAPPPWSWCMARTTTPWTAGRR